MAELLPAGMLSFAELEKALASIPDQTTGDPCAISNIGEPYVEFKAFAIARPGDEKMVERYVVASMVEQLNNYFSDKAGRIYWRMPFESDVKPESVVLRMDVNGPDKDFLTDQPCVMDKNWVRVAAHCRLIRARCAALDPAAAAAYVAASKKAA